MSHFVQQLDGCDESLFSTKLVQTVIEYMWDHYSSMIRSWILIPFVFYFISGCIYFYTVSVFNGNESHNM
jgi:phosphate/sulfate permease